MQCVVRTVGVFLVLLGLGGCAVYPAAPGYGYAYPYGAGYPYVAGPEVVIGGGGFWGHEHEHGEWGHGGWGHEGGGGWRH